MNAKNSLTRFIPWICLAIFAAWIVSAFFPKPETGFHYRDFGRLPVLMDGRIQPLDSVARNSLLQIRTKQTVLLDDGRAASATEWLLTTLANPEVADGWKIFRVDNSEVLALLKLSQNQVYFSYNQLKTGIDELRRQADRIDGIESSKRSVFESQIMKLYAAVNLYDQLEVSLKPPGTTDFARELAVFQKSIPPGIAAMRARAAGEKVDCDALSFLLSFMANYDTTAKYSLLLTIPPANDHSPRDAWENIGTNLLRSVRDGQLNPAVKSYATMVSAFRANNPAAFNQAAAEYRISLADRYSPELNKAGAEFIFNSVQPFYLATVIYIVALLLAFSSWFRMTDWLRRSAFYLIALAWTLHTFGLGFRMYLEGRPPVTNLYSSAVFIGWGAVILGMILEKIYCDGVGCVVASFVGFVTLIIAHNLALGGDTMEMMRAVLNTNFWLATHVVTVTMGYASTFVAGLLAIIYILRGLLTTTLTTPSAKALARMVYGVVCFATFFSFIGTVLGGIWADQSWGRFWGWDPKENGALLIVLWNATILHARWGGLVRERGLMILAVIGNIITSWSWFGVNMLGIGLHSYGFTNAAFQWLMFFVTSQLIIILLGLSPLKFWRSFQNQKTEASANFSKSI
jgi:ABC-type transport system involved in cytochrome c biogenesis permease subunit